PPPVCRCPGRPGNEPHLTGVAYATATVLRNHLDLVWYQRFSGAVIAARADVSNITACLIPMGVWCDPVRNQLRENGCDTDLADSHDRTTEGISPDDNDDETTIVIVIRRWIHICT